MGYRSAVSYVIRFETHAKRDEYVALVLAKNDPDLTKALGQCYVPSPNEQLDDPVIYFNVVDWKWYSEYPEVKAHTTLYEWAHELYPDACDYRFVRVGENPDDIEEESTHGEFDECEDLYPATFIESRYPAKYPLFDPQGERA
jgi:hypothetical protein